MNRILASFLRRLWAIALAAMGFLLIAPPAAAVEVVTYYHWDLVGSPVVATDEQGLVKWREEYLPYGERLLNEPEASDNSRWFAGHAADIDTGVVCMGARWYDPVIGRFLSVDPIAFSDGNPQTFNRFAYANDNPYRYIDPTGGNPLSVLDWYDFAKNVGGLLVEEIVYTAAVIAGDEGVQQLALQGMVEKRADAALSVVGVLSPIPGAGRALKVVEGGGVAARGAATVVNKHHTIPREILKQLPGDVAKAVRGKAGAPNRWPIPEDLHKAIHKGAGGGAYNEAFKQRLQALGRDPTPAEVVGIRDDLVKQFGLEAFRP